MIKKVLLVLAVFALTFAASTLTNKADAGPCRYRCICGVSHKCCTNNGVETCKPAAGISCPQVYPC